MSHSRRLRSIVSVLAAIVAVVGLSLTMTGNAAAAGSGGPDAPAAAPDPKVDRIQKDAPGALHQRAVQPCPEGLPREAPGAVLQRGPHRPRPPDHPGRRPAALGPGPADIQDAYHLPDSGPVRSSAIVDAFGDSTRRPTSPPSARFYGLPPCTVANGCFTHRQPGRRHQSAAARRPRLGPGDVARPRRRLRRLPELLASCSSRATTARSTTSASPSTPPSRSARSSSRTPTACPARTPARRTSTTTTTTPASR